MITVFTPTYNRNNELKKLYKSLLRQVNVDFEWLIIDDGSTDNTEQYIKQLIKQNNIKIRYIKQKNGGKPSAYNKALENALGDIFLCIDSDDSLISNILGCIEMDFQKYVQGNNIAGIMYLRCYSNKKNIVGTKFPTDKMLSNFYDIYHKNNVKGDKLIVFKTNIAKKYKFPIIKGEKFVPEALVFYRIAQKYKTICLNKIAAYTNYLPNGYSANYFDLAKNNPLGNRLFYNEIYSYKKSWYNTYAYILFSFYAHLKFKRIINEHTAKMKIILLYLPTYIVYKLR